MPLQEIMLGMRGRFIHYDHATFAFWEIDKDFELPEHNHYHEQITQILDGEFELVVNGEMKLLKAGSVAIITSNAIHSGRAITACKILDVFSPKREDYIFNG